MVLPVVNAQDTTFTAVQGNTLDIRHTISANGSGANIDFANITVRFPRNNTLFISAQPMTYSVSSNDWNFTLNETQTLVIGIYPYTICAFSTIEPNECFSFNYEITRTGTILGISGGLAYLAIFIVALFMFIITLFGAMAIRFEDHKDPEGRLVSIRGFKYVKIILMAMAWLELVFIFSIANDMATSFLFLQSAGRFFRIAYLVMLSATMPVVLGGILFCFISVLSDQKIQKSIIRGIPINR